MAITNDPIMLNETGLKIAEQLDRQNGYLAMLAEGKRSEIYNSMNQIASIIRGNDVESNKKIFPIGDQIIMPWKDMDDPAHNTNETAYQVAWDIVHHGLVELRDGSTVPGMFLMMHLCSAYGVQFSHQQAFKLCPDGLPAGTYHLTLGQTWGSKEAVSGSTWQFTLTKPVPAGGALSGFEGMPDQASSAWRVKSWTNRDDANPIETVVVTSGNGGTDLGTMAYILPNESGMMGMQRTAYGHNRWKTSAIRQYLNSSGANWFSLQEDYDIRPDQYNKQGFMTGFNEDFLKAIKPVKVTTALNTVENLGATTEDTYDTFFLPSLEQINAQPQLAGVEGDYFEYWRQRLGMAGFAPTGSTNIFDAFKIPAINANSPQYGRLRSAYRGHSNSPWGVFSSGYVSHYYASYAHRVSPVCVIC